MLRSLFLFSYILHFNLPCTLCFTINANKNLVLRTRGTDKRFTYAIILNQSNNKSSESLHDDQQREEQQISIAASQELEKTKARLEKMAFEHLSAEQQVIIKQQQQQNQTPEQQKDGIDSYFVERQKLYQIYIHKPASALKMKLKELKLNTSGRKPDLAYRMAQYALEERHPDLKTDSSSLSNDHDDDDDDDDDDNEEKPSKKFEQNSKIDSTTTEKTQTITTAPILEEDEKRKNQSSNYISSFASLSPLSLNAGNALGSAQINKPTLIQHNAIPKIISGENVILHAETGSGKTLAYLLPITEYLHGTITSDATSFNINPSPSSEEPILLLLTPTRELASQVAGVAEVLAPEGCVRLITEPSDLSNDTRGDMERGEVDTYGGRKDRTASKRGGKVGRIVVGSAKSIMISLYGDKKLPAPPTPKPAAKAFLRRIRWVVLDEVDRLLNIPKTRQDRKKFSSKKHEKPAAILTAAVTRLTLSRAQIIACSATVGRPLRRELTRVLGLPSQECPEVVRGIASSSDTIDQNQINTDGVHIGRIISIPTTVENYVIPCDGTSSGSLLTTAALVAKKLSAHEKKMLMVLSKGCGLTTQDSVGALRHFNSHTNPQSLADALQGGMSGMSMAGTDKLIQTHREVSGAIGVGESTENKNEGGYLLVTGEDSIRGLHLDKLDVVIVIGRPLGPDEYIHIAGRTGRAGRMGGKVINIVSYEQATALTSWEKMLNVDFIPIDMDEVEKELL